MGKLKQDASLFWEWCKIHREFGLWPSINEFLSIRKAYAEPHRYYHTFDHIYQCIHFLNENYGNAPGSSLVKFALFYHDIIYDVRRKNNEALSATRWEDYGKTLIGLESKMSATQCRQVGEMILMTANHKLPKNVPLFYNMMCDADMHIFLCPDSRYIDYARAVWKEYGPVHGRDAYLEGRLAFLSTVDPLTVYHTHQARSQVHHARANIELEREILKSDPDRILI